MNELVIGNKLKNLYYVSNKVEFQKLPYDASIGQEAHWRHRTLSLTLKRRES